MKRIKYIFAFIIVSFAAFSQEEFHGGFLGGITASQIDNDEMGGYKKLGMTGGMFVSRNFTEEHRGQFELKYIQKGAAEPAYSFKKRLDYLELAFMYKYHFEKGFELEGGLGTDFLINVSSSYMDVDDPNASFAEMDMPLNLGASYFLGDNLAINGRMAYSMFLLGGYWNNSLIFSLYYYLK